MKFALTGSSGILGEALQSRSASAGNEVISIKREDLIEGGEALRDALRSADVVIHAAANTDVEACESDPPTCYRDNFLLSENLASICAHECKKLVFVSSTGIYGSQQVGAYAEFDQVYPQTHHHRAKLLAEQSVLRFSPRNIVIRTGWLFGGSFKKKKNFVARRIDEAEGIVRQGGHILRSNPIQIGNPTFTEDVADRIFLTIAKNGFGIFNCVNGGSASRLEYVKAIVKFAGIDIEVLPSINGQFQRAAKVSNNESAINWRFDMLRYPAMPDWRARLQYYVKKLLALD